MSEKLLATAQVGKTHGYEGFLRIYSLSGEITHLKKLKDCVIKTSKGVQVAVHPVEVKTHSDALLMKFSGYETKEKAAQLSGGVMYITRNQAPKLKKGEYYIADLFGLKLVSNGITVGTIECVSEGAQADYLVVKKEEGGEILIPNMIPFVSKPDFDKGEITLLMPELIEE